MAHYNTRVENVEEIPPPVPVAPIPVWRRVLGGFMLVAMWTAIGVCVLTLSRPRTLVARDGDEIRIHVGPEVLPRQIVALAIAVVCAVAGRVVIGRRWWGSVGLVVAVVLVVPVWHQRAARVVITTETITAPVEAGLLPGAPVTLRFDQMAFLTLVRRESRASKFQHCYMKNGQLIKLELGPLIRQAGPLIEERARAKGVKVDWQ